MRLVTRADFDGLVCGALITQFEAVDSYLFVEPKFMQDGLVPVRSGDVIANLPYHPNCTLWFDHHITNTTPDFPKPIMPGKGGFRLAPSAARVVFEYYSEIARGEAADRTGRLAFLHSDRITYLLQEADRIDAGQLEREDVLNPQGYVLVSMTTDGTRAEDEPYWLRIIELLRETSLTETLADPEVAKRCRQVRNAQEKLKGLLLERTRLQGNVIYSDLRGVTGIPDGNRFLVFTLFPQGNIQVKVTDDVQRKNTTAISVGYNIFNPTSSINVGELLKGYGGGGHKVVGSCRVANDHAEQAIREIVAASKFTTGVIAFHPQTRSSPNQIHHADKDVICFVLKGRGRLRLQDRKILLRPGMLCHIPKRTPHDFAAGQRAELVLLYSLVRTGEA
jgi:mannose-6-phosphate isomerase-like protein (cupin superfamily)